ncbi:MAG: hypothetical protein V4472_04955 [Pseudomonadota bacterium]
MTEPQIDSAGLLLGEMKGQLRELIHNLNTMSAKIDSLTERVIGASGLPGKVRELEERIAALEADKNKRDGAMGFGSWLLRSPAIAWLATAGVAIWALLKGKA